LNIVLITAFGVGGATVLGAIVGFTFKKAASLYSEYVMALAAGIMLSASVFSLIIPSLERGGACVTVIGMLIGAVTIDLLDGAADKICEKLSFSDDTGSRKSVFLLISAIAIHNLPEGIAAGVGFGSGDIGDAIMIAGGIALQNIPEGMVLIAPMLGAGITPKKSLILASFTGVIEIVGTFLGYFAVSIASYLLPFILSYAGGCMLYVILGEMLPVSRLGDSNRASNYFFLSGFAFMLIFDALIG
jgi:ZIP family zinc transporter